MDVTAKVQFGLGKQDIIVNLHQSGNRWDEKTCGSHQDPKERPNNFYHPEHAYGCTVSLLRSQFVQIVCQKIFSSLNILVRYKLDQKKTLQYIHILFYNVQCLKRISFFSKALDENTVSVCGTIIFSKAWTMISAVAVCSFYFWLSISGVGE